MPELHDLGVVERRHDDAVRHVVPVDGVTQGGRDGVPGALHLHRVPGVGEGTEHLWQRRDPDPRQAVCVEGKETTKKKNFEICKILIYDYFFYGLLDVARNHSGIKSQV